MLFYKDFDVIDLESVRPREKVCEPLGILAVGDLTSWRLAGRALPRSGDIVMADFHEISADLIDHLRPGFVVSPAICRQFDCLDLAAALCAAGFTGIYRALAGHLPNPRIIQREVRAMCPRLDFDFIDAGIFERGRVM